MIAHRCLLSAVTSTSWAANRTSTSPSTQRISSLVVRNVMRRRVPGRALALVVTQLLVLQWMRSGSCAGERLGVGA